MSLVLVGMPNSDPDKTSVPLRSTEKGKMYQGQILLSLHQCEGNTWTRKSLAFQVVKRRRSLQAMGMEICPLERQGELLKEAVDFSLESDLCTRVFWMGW